MIADARAQKRDDLNRAMKGTPPPPGRELEDLLVSWLAISSVRQPEQANPLRFPFLKWAIEGRAREVLAYLKKSRTAEARTAAEEIVRISKLPFPPKNPAAQAQAMDIWAWLKVELYGKVD